MKKTVFIVTLLINFLIAYSQITMTDGSSSSINTNTTFYDPGGTSNYANSLYVTHTITPATAGRYVRVTFTAFNTEASADLLYIYNGTIPCASSLIATYSGTSTPATITSSAPNGSLTFVFVSDANNRRAGFTSTLSQQTTAGTIAYSACAPPPINDHPCNAIALSTITTGCTNVSGTVTAATHNGGVPQPTCITTSAPFTDVWYYFTATGTSTNIQTESVSGSSDLVMQVFTNSSGSACTGTWTSIDCDNDNHPTNAMPYLSINGTASNPLTTVVGQRYYIRIFPYTSESSATFNLCVFNTPPPSCTSNIQPTNRSIASSYTPYMSWNSVSGATGYDVYLGTSNPPTTLVSSNQAATNYTPTTALTLGTTYYWYIVPRNIGGPATGCNSTVTQFTTPSPPANDNCNNAIRLIVNPTSTLTSVSTFSTNFATQSMAGCLGTADDDVWFYFEATSNRHNFFLTTSVGADLMHEVFSGSCGSLTSILCSDPNSSSSDCFIPGQRYYVRVYTYSLNTASGDVTLGVGSPTTSTIDVTCLTASQICAPFSFTAGVNQPSGGAGCGANYGCLSTYPNPEYHWLQVTNTGTLNYTLSSTAGDVDFALWRISGTPSPATTCGGVQTINCGSSLGAPVACSYSSSATEVINASVTPGYYLLLATNFANANGIVTLTANTGNTAVVGCPCIISELTATPTICNPSNNQYTINGTLSYNSFAPTSGTLTITDNNGNFVRYSYPFPASPFTYSITGNSSDGVVHSVRAQFSSRTSCSRCASYTAPAICCTLPVPAVTNIVDAGCGFTFDLVATGAGGGPYEWSKSSTFSGLITTTTHLVFPFGTNSERYYVRKVGQTCSTSILVVDSTLANGLTTGYCTSCFIGDGETKTFYDASNNIILTIQDSLGGSFLGTTTACAYVDSANINYNGQDYMRRHFNVNVTNNGPAIVSVYLSANDVTNIVSASADDMAGGYGIFSSLNDLCVTAYHGAGETPLSNITKTLIPHSSLNISGPFPPTNYYIVTFPVSDFSGFYCHACNPSNNALPVKLLSFDGYHSFSDNVLRWVTASEINNDYFVLERSEDGETWHKLATLDGMGNSTTGRTYMYYDIDVNTKNYYYRLKQIDFDGAFEYSNIIYLKSDEMTVNNISPNPTQNILHFSIASEESKDVFVRVIDVTGRLVLNESFTILNGVNTLSIDVNDLVPAAYTLQITDPTGKTRINNTFIKQ